MSTLTLDKDSRAASDRARAENAANTTVTVVSSAGLYTVVGSVSDMQNITITPSIDGKTISVLGRHEINDGGGGLFRWDASNNETANNGTLFESNNSATGRWERIYEGQVNVNWFNVFGDGVENDYEGISDALNSLSEGETLVFPKSKTFFIGDVAGDTGFFDIDKNIRLVFNDSEFLCTASGTASGAYLFKFIDCVTYVDSLVLNQSNFDFGSGNRGVIAVAISAVTENTKNHYVKCHVKKGQSPLTVVSSSPVDYRSSNIKVNLTADTTYYGINLAYNGDNVSGSVYANSYNRLFFGYDISNVDLDIYGGSDPRLTSGQINIHNRKVLPTRNINLNASLDVLSSPIIINDLTADSGTAVFENINLDVKIKSVTGTIESNYLTDGLIRIGSFKPDSNWETSVSQTTEVNCKIRYSAEGLDPHSPIKIFTPSSGERIVDVVGDLFSENSILGRSLLSYYSYGDFLKRKSTSNSSSISFDIVDIIGLNKNISYIINVLLSARENSTFFNQNTTSEKWVIHGFISSDSVLNIQSANRVYVSKTGTKTITTTISAGGGTNIDIDFTGYNVSSSTSIELVIGTNIF